MTTIEGPKADLGGPERSSRRAAWGAVGVTMVLWASAFVAIRHLGATYSPVAITEGRLAVGALCLAVPALRAGVPRLPARSWASMLAIGLLWYFGYNVLLNSGEHRIDAGTSSMLISLAPVFVGILAVLVLGERLGRWLVLGLALAFAGVVVIGVGSSGGDGGHDLVGALMCVGAALAGAIAIVLQKPVLTHLKPVQITWLGCLVGAVVCLPWTGQLVHAVHTAPASSSMWVGYLGVFPTSIAFTTYGFALSRMEASQAGVTTFLVPPITVLMAWAILGETPPALAYLGGALALLGVWVSRRK